MSFTYSNNNINEKTQEKKQISLFQTDICYFEYHEGRNEEKIGQNSKIGEKKVTTM